MSVTCPKCRFVRPANTDAPDWQCPSCGVAYAKARALLYEPDSLPVRSRPETNSTGVPWGKVLPAVFMVLMTLLAYRLILAPSVEGGRAAPRTKVTSTDQLAALAATVQSGDITIYSASWCGSCAQAKQWMTQNGFKYGDCDVEASRECGSRFRELGGKGVPLLVVKGQQLRTGFNSEEFVAALQKAGADG